MFARILVSRTSETWRSTSPSNSCELISFIDDDARHPGLLRVAIRRVFSLQSGCVGVGASILPVDADGNRVCQLPATEPVLLPRNSSRQSSS